MSDLLDTLVKRIKPEDYNIDGTMNSHYREYLRSRGWSESKINSTESRHIRRAAIDKEVASWQQELKRRISESDAREPEERRQQAERLGIPYKPFPTSNNNNLSRQTRAQKMAGLDREELLSQGFLEPDDFYSHNDEAAQSPPRTYTPPAFEPPDIEF